MSTTTTGADPQTRPGLPSDPADDIAQAAVTAHGLLQVEPRKGSRANPLRSFLAQSVSLLLAEFPGSVGVTFAGREAQRDWLTVSFTTGAQVRVSIDQLDRPARRAVAATLGRPDLGSDV